MTEETNASNENVHFKNCLERFEKMLRRNERYFFDTNDFEDLLNHYISINDNGKALKVTNCAIEQHPYSVLFIIRKAQLLSAANQQHKALDVIAKAESLDPSNTEMYITKGSIYSQMGLYNKSIECYNDAIKKADETDDIYLCIAFEYENMSDYYTALRYLKKALEVNPENDAALYESAFCY